MNIFPCFSDLYSRPPAVFIVPNNPPLPWFLIEQRLLTRFKQIKLKAEYSKESLYWVSIISLDRKPSCQSSFHYSMLSQELNSST